MLLALVDIVAGYFFCTFWPILLLHSRISIWHLTVVCLSVCLWCCSLWRSLLV